MQGVLVDLRRGFIHVSQERCLRQSSAVSVAELRVSALVAVDKEFQERWVQEAAFLPCSWEQLHRATQTIRLWLREAEVGAPRQLPRQINGKVAEEVG
jgi:hypothetical protein